MPSIPQSLLWISLVVLWLFVLVPMLISRRDTVRRTSDVALAARVLNTGRGARLLRGRKPAAGHHSDPDWRPARDEVDEFDDDHYKDDEPATTPHNAVVVLAAVALEPESPYLDVDIVEEDSGALPIGASAQSKFGEEQVLPLEFEENTATFTIDDLQEVDGLDSGEEGDGELGAPEDVEDPEAEWQHDAEEMTEEFEPVTEDVTETDAEDDTDYEYEYVDDESAEFEAQPEADVDGAGSMSQSRRRRYESKTAAAVSARKYAFRKRMLTVLSVLLIVSATAAYLATPTLWWASGSVGAFTVLYLAYLRRQTRIEERIRRRRAQRMMRSHLGVENTDDHEFDVVPARLRRPGAVVLEIDDEDPVFEHLDYAPFAREYDLPTAAGQ